MQPANIPNVISILKKEIKRFKTPYVTEVAAEVKKDPFKVLVSCILSLRTKDDTTREASVKLFRLASTAEGIARLPQKRIEKAIYPVGFYRVKAAALKGISKELIVKHGGKVPDTIESLLTLKGVGRKTANLVVTMGFGKPGICVDTHVHRIVNRWGFVSTKTPEETEFALRKKLHKRYWIIINDLLVTFGRNICRPISPFCSGCAVFKYCKRAGVKKQR
ncbi:MAG: endonuclease III [Deltaproteobacteria bacterium]|nr:endonuclease III [Deltaproteobacteria bacterium]